MNILIVSHEYPPIGGGGANACMYLSREYEKQGHRVTIVTVWFEGLAEIETSEKIQIIRIKSKRRYKEHCSFREMASYLFKAWPIVDKLEKENHFDICQVFFGIPSGPIGYLLYKKYKVPYIIRFGGGDIPGFQDRFALIYKLIGPLLKIIWNNAKALIANSEGLRKMALDFYDKKDIGIIYNGVDTKKFYPLENKVYDENSKFIRILFVSRLIERKGLQFVIPRLKEIQKKSEQQICLVLVGDGPYRKSLEKLVLQHGVEKIVSFVGQKDKAELLEYYQSADIFILPSKKEGMPNVVLEAMACGLPIVMTPCEGSKELVADNGYIVKVEDIPNKIIELCKQKDIRQQMAECSFKRVNDFFKWEKIGQIYIQLMENIVARNKKDSVSI